MSLPEAAAAGPAVDPFRSLGALRLAHTELLKTFHTLDEDKLPPEFLAAIQAFLARGRASGLLFDVDEDRADAQTFLNYWTTVLYGAGVLGRPTLLLDFDAASARSLVGDTSPYVGLGTFQERDSTVFFGRRKLLQQIAGVLDQSRFVAVVGLSGSGKSSLVRAGLLPQIRTGEVSGSGGWRVLDPIVPGADPLGALAAATKPADTALDAWQQIVAADDERFVQALGATPVLLVVDQLEEVFTLIDDKVPSSVAARKTFVAQLVRLVRHGNVRHTLIVTLRSDFEDALARYPDLQALCDSQHVFRVTPLDPLGLRNAIERPAARLGVTFEKGLVQELMQQVLGEPAGLPLLQFALLKLWERREGATITWNAYRDLGNSVRAILAESAKRTYESFKLEEDRAIVKAIFHRLAVVGLGGEVTSKRVPRSALQIEHAAPDRVKRVLDTLVTAGLIRVTPGVTPDDDQFEVTHEALLRNWPMLTDWLGEEREHQRKRLQLAAAADWWKAHGEDKSGLLSGLRLEEAKEYTDLSPLEARFVETSHRVKTADQRKFWWLSLGVFTAAMMLLAFAGFQTWQLRGASTRLSSASATLRAAQEATAQAKRETAEAEAARKKIESDTQKARTEFTAVLAEVAKAVDGKNKAQDELRLLDDRLTKARKELEASKAATVEAQTVAQQRTVELEVATQQLGDRPSLKLTSRGTLGVVPRQWSALEKYAGQIQASAASVARVQIGEVKQTGFLIGRDMLATFWSQAAGAASEGVAEFPAPAGGGEPVRVRISGRVSHDAKTNVAVYRLAKGPELDRLRPLQYNPSGPIYSRAVYVLGFGATARYAAVQPGYIVSTPDPEGFFSHDCRTSAGNSGAPIIDLMTGAVVGVHWGAMGANSESGPGVKRGVSSAVIARLSGVGPRR